MIGHSRSDQPIFLSSLYRVFFFFLWPFPSAVIRDQIKGIEIKKHRKAMIDVKKRDSERGEGRQRVVSVHPSGRLLRTVEVLDRNDVGGGQTQTQTQMQTCNERWALACAINIDITRRQKLENRHFALSRQPPTANYNRGRFSGYIFCWLPSAGFALSPLASSPLQIIPYFPWPTKLADVSQERAAWSATTSGVEEGEKEKEREAREPTAVRTRYVLYLTSFQARCSPKFYYCFRNTVIRTYRNLNLPDCQTSLTYPLPQRISYIAGSLILCRLSVN